MAEPIGRALLPPPAAGANVGQEYIQPPFVQAPGGPNSVAPRGAQTAAPPPVERHFLANLLGGVLGALGSLMLFGTPIGWIGAGLFALDATLDATTGKGALGHFASLIGWDSMRNARSLGSTIAERLSPPAAYGYQPAQRYPATTLR